MDMIQYTRPKCAWILTASSTGSLTLHPRPDPSPGPVRHPTRQALPALALLAPTSTSCACNASLPSQRGGPVCLRGCPALDTRQRLLPHEGPLLCRDLLPKAIKERLCLVAARLAQPC